MKKFVYLCVMMLICMNMMAQIDLDDDNWTPLIIENFTGSGRGWERNFIESQSGNSNFQPIWRCYFDEWNSGVTLDYSLHQVFQRSQCQFQQQDNKMHIVAEFKGSTPMQCGTYELPFPSWHYYNCDSTHNWLYYYSGCIETLEKIRYGYFEMRCKLPIHEGAYPAFWLWSADGSNPEDKYYEEIDILEYSWKFEDSLGVYQFHPHAHGQGNPYCFTSGIYFNDTSTYHGWKTSRARVFPMINDSLSHWHTFACEWLPEHVIWYCDGNVVDEYYNPDSIPNHPLTLKVNYGIDNYAMQGHNYNGIPLWQGCDNMIIDYINVYQLKWDCDTDEVIAQQSDLNGFSFAVKKSIAVTSTIEPIIVASNDKVTFRATDSFEITGPFQVNSGGEMTIIMQQCPE